ncbi:inositol polyphosphate kinase-domain-containing protein [Tuber brumale]|nr:inositol polyphosphate kinase-domain-containing protein [Tuber brumale]
MESCRLKASDLRAGGVLPDESGALVIKPCTAREVAFYTFAAEDHRFRKFMATFIGTLELWGPEQTEGPATHCRNTSIVLQNLTHDFGEACIMDVKLGAQLLDDEAPQDNRDRLDAVSTAATCRSLGLRIAGMKVWKGKAAGRYEVFDKYHGRTFAVDSCLEAIKEYFSGDISEEQKRLIAERFLKKVTEVDEVLEGLGSRMYSAPLLFAYEDDGKALETALNQEEENAKKPAKYEDYDSEDEQVKEVEELKLIDFAHASWSPGKGPEECALQGVRSTEMLLPELVR